MKILVDYQYPEKEIAQIEVPEHYAVHGHSGNIGFSYSDKRVGMRNSEVLRNNVKFYMVLDGLITDAAEILSIEIYP